MAQYVYLFRVIGTDHYKIGCTKNLRMRIEALNHDFRRFNIQLEAVTWTEVDHGMRVIESNLHQLFKDKRTRSLFAHLGSLNTTTEWFNLDEFEVEYLQQLWQRP